jgi:hypothetical protein
MIAGAYARFPPMAVKLNGEIAAINPSSPLCRTYVLIKLSKSLLASSM